MKELIIKKEHLPDTIKDLHKFILVGKEKLKAQQAKINAIKNLDVSHTAMKAAQEDGLRIGEVVLNAEAKLGELLKGIPNKKASSGGGTRSLPKDITKKQSHYAQQVYENKDLIEETLKEAEEKEELPTRSNVLKKAKTRKKKKKIKEQKEAIANGTIKLPKGKYEVIVIDPPWSYGRKYDANSSRVASPYPEMSIEEIKQDFIKRDYVADTCVLWLWTTHQFIWNAKELLKEWGFEYKAILVWNKEKLGMGSWLRMQCEFCLLGIKGKPTWNLNNERDIITEARREHSRKPDGFYEMIDKLCLGKKLDYFSREKRKGWDTFGFDVDSFKKQRGEK